MPKTGRPPVPAISRFTPRYLVDAQTGCWRWQGNLDKDGYGKFWWKRPDGSKGQRAHMFSYETFVGPYQAGQVTDHLCRNRACVNPDHLEAVSNAENTLRGETFVARNKAKTHCKHGHEFTPENTVDLGGGQRACRSCRRAKDKRRHAKMTTEQREHRNYLWRVRYHAKKAIGEQINAAD